MRSHRETAGLEGSAPIFAALGDATRLKLVARLSRGGPQSIARLTRGTPFTRQAITKHLHVLADAGFVRGVRLGRESLWEVKPQQFDVAHRYLNLISKRWDTALGRLKKLVEE
ncbi:MAG TPA: helix-turn-helix domain-containing protein [Candidatus Limnocylindrales bacterium]|nr:helix-turn-helix domain-containing protein [Candidatus Limnocylindrales bacterium]